MDIMRMSITSLSRDVMLALNSCQSGKVVVAKMTDAQSEALGDERTTFDGACSSDSDCGGENKR